MISQQYWLFCTQESFLVVLRKPYGILGLNPGRVGIYKTNALLTALSFWSYPILFWFL